MPTNNGIMSEAEQQKVREWLKEHWKNWSCPFSGHTDWDLGQLITETRGFSGGGLNVGAPVYPYVVLTCRGCGYTVFINAVKMGIFSKKEGEHAAEKPS